MSNAQEMSKKGKKGAKRARTDMEETEPVQTTEIEAEGEAPKHINRFLQTAKNEKTSVYWVLETGLNEEEFAISVKDLQKNYMCRLCRQEFHRVLRFPLNGSPTDQYSSVGMFACPLDFDPETFRDYFSHDCDFYQPVFKKKD